WSTEKAVLAEALRLLDEMDAALTNLDGADQATLILVRDLAERAHGRIEDAARQLFESKLERAEAEGGPLAELHQASEVMLVFAESIEDKSIPAIHEGLRD